MTEDRKLRLAYPWRSRAHPLCSQAMRRTTRRRPALLPLAEIEITQACRDRNEGHLCEWEGAIRLPQSCAPLLPASASRSLTTPRAHPRSNYTRDQEAVELRSQLDRLEGLLGVLSSTTYADGDLAAVAGLASALQGSSSARPQDLDVERTSAAEALGLLAVSI